MNSWRREIKQVAEARGIEDLVHFTPAMHAPRILEHGLLQRDVLRERWPDEIDERIVFPDTLRLDGEDGICLSIEGPNEALFTSKQDSLGIPFWALIVVDVSVLWEKQCCFFRRNAASREEKNDRRWKNGSYALERMFDPRPPRTEREGLQDNWPTFDDAEVQVYEAIEPAYFKGFYFDGGKSDLFRESYPNLIGDLEIGELL